MKTKERIKSYYEKFMGNPKETEVKRRLNLMGLQETLRFRVGLCSLLDRYGIETPEQLATYNRFAFWVGGNWESRGSCWQRWQDAIAPKQYATLQKYLGKIGMSFAPEKPTKTPPPYLVIGRDIVKGYLTDALDRIEDFNPYLSDKEVSAEAVRMMVERTPDTLVEKKYGERVIGTTGFSKYYLKDFYRRAFLTVYTS